MIVKKINFIIKFYDRRRYCLNLCESGNNIDIRTVRYIGSELNLWGDAHGFTRDFNYSDCTATRNPNG